MLSSLCLLSRVGLIPRHVDVLFCEWSFQMSALINILILYMYAWGTFYMGIWVVESRQADSLTSQAQWDQDGFQRHTHFTQGAKIKKVN